MISGAREAPSSFFRRLVAWAAAQELSAFVVPGTEVARAYGLDLEAAGLRLADTPRHASVLVLVGELPEGLNGAAVAYAQMPRPRALFAVGADDVSPLPAPDVSVSLGQETLADGVAQLRRSFAENAFSTEVADFDVEAVRTETEYVCPMHPEVVSDEPGSCPKCGMDLVPRESAGGMDHDQDHGHMDHFGHEGMEHGHKEHDQASREHPGHGGHDDADHGAMDLGDDSGGLGEMDMSHQKKASIAAGVLGTLAAVGVALLVDWTPTGTVTDPVEQTRLLGMEIMERSMLIFETAGVTILTAMVAATAIAVEGRRRK